MRLNILWLNASKPNDSKTQLRGISERGALCVCVAIELIGAGGVFFFIDIVHDHQYQ